MNCLYVYEANLKKMFHFIQLLCQWILIITTTPITSIMQRIEAALNEVAEQVKRNTPLTNEDKALTKYSRVFEVQ